MVSEYVKHISVTMWSINDHYIASCTRSRPQTNLNTLRTGHLNCLNAWFLGFKPFNPLNILSFFKNL